MATVSDAAVGLRSERGPILLALMLCTALVAIDSTIIATAVPSVVASLGGFSEFPWLFSVYLLAQAVTVPVNGKLADLFGRKPLLLYGIATFLVGSTLCGLAWNMAALIAFRLVQGVGAGAISPMSLTIVGDLYSLRERARVQGYLASVWAMSSVVGPALGGVFSEYASWRWIFFINIPVCGFAAFMIVRQLRESVERTRPKIDYLGAALLTTGCTLLILGALEGGEAWPWRSGAGVAVPAAGALLLAGFVLVERRVPVPILPLWVFSRRLLLTCGLASACVGAILLGLTSYVPTFSQDVLGVGPLVAGFAVGVLTLGWPISASQAGRIYLRIGFRWCALIGSCTVVAGALLLLLLNAASSVFQVGATCFAVGVGLGLVAPTTLVAAQSSVGWGERGVVTGNTVFCRSLGAALGVAVFGAIANAAIGSTTPSAHDGPAARIALAAATHHVFYGVVVVALAMTVLVLCIPATVMPAAAMPVAPPAAGPVVAETA